MSTQTPLRGLRAQSGAHFGAVSHGFGYFDFNGRFGNWAASQTSSGTYSQGNLRAQVACLEGRGYSVK